MRIGARPAAAARACPARNAPAPHADRGFLRTGFSALAAALALQAAAKAAEPPALSGELTFEHWCAPCHAPGPRHPGTTALQAKYRGAEPAALEERRDLDAGTVKYLVRHGIANMAPFRKTEITDAELDALAKYLAHSPDAP